ncbi:organic solvent tolerance protein [Sulfurimonas gotlandica GD1]|uniref:Organic solvent tolerance protein n=1 Tax=Sulfurimonas gotlandica (strain DSM 19862 / JCM 16533 / GD1) TaxID=929558 RepID=B6BM97_SULGG|nr:LPS assembly protein LptD [Sulfurimonas gotlandica]EDZ61777.1 organic solvent tolerance protein, putative [Sulfurimonas gotlandica GD1]EHP29325.1 organic solvent tolerance protein [Sulfurimonas gotlandica GD1]
MFKLLTLFAILTSVLYAADKVEIYATSMDSKDSIVKASGEVTVVYKDYFLSAQNATYDKNTGELELFGNIRANQGQNYKLLGDYAKLNIAKKERVFKPFFMLEKESKVWISADEGCALNKDFDIQSGMMSGCNPNDPLWKIHFSSSTYNSDDKWLNIYNARIFIYDIPVFYTPYFGYSLDTTRRTGLLTPAFGTSAVEGVYFEQPIYIAEQNWWDLELKPQVRTNRGYGGYTTFRFVDSKISKGQFTTGYFKEQDSYFNSQSLANDTHYGHNFLYDNSDVINQWLGTNFKGQSGLYMDINSMNDVDYINLSTNDTTQNATSKQVLSRVNLFYNTDSNYFGAYFKYYQDLTKLSNEATLQKLPTFQYHRYLNTLFGDHLIYNLDMQSNNIYREVGKHVTQTNVNIPITLQTSIFDEYLNVSYKAYLYAQHSKFSGTETIKSGDYENGYFARNYHVLSASSQVSRAYDDFTHVVGFGSTYTIGGAETKTGFYSDYETFCSDANNKSTPQCEFYNITAVEEELKLDFTQYLYDSAGSQILYNRLAQNISYQNTQNSLGELENELDYQISKGIRLYNNMFYNYDQNKLSKLYNQLTFSGNGFNVSFSHLYKDTFLEKTTAYTPYTSYITSSASYTYNKHYSYNVKYNYDVESSLKKGAEIGFLYQKRCWNFGLKYLENNRPVLTDTGSTSIYDRYIYFTVVLKPMMSSDSGPLFEYKLPETTQGL